MDFEKKEHITMENENFNSINTNDENNDSHLQNQLNNKYRELNCIYHMHKILERPDVTLDIVCQELTNIIPLAINSNSPIYSKLTLNGKVYTNQSFNTSLKLAQKHIYCKGKDIGLMELFADNIDFGTNEQSLKQKSDLVNVLVGMLSSAIEKFTNNIEKQQNENKIDKFSSALGTVISTVDQEKNQVQEKIVLNIENNIIPIVKKIQYNQSILNNPPKIQAYLNIIEKELNDITSDFLQKFENLKIRLTPVELKVSHYIKSGYSAKEIGELLGSSPNTIKNHSNNIRRKLGLTNKKVSLKKYIYSIGK